MKQIAFLIILTILGMFSASAQEINGSLTRDDLLPDFSKLTPEASAFAKYGSVGVSEYSGTPNISIPLYTVQAGDAQVPILLNYDATGIKTDQEATMVGLGWNLVYGGFITRIESGKADFLPKLSPADSISEYIQYQFAERTDRDLYATTKQVAQNVETANFQAERRKLVSLKLGEHSPDIYQASFCGHSVSFIIDDVHNNAIVLDDDGFDYKITYTASQNVPLSITITDDMGINYTFQPYTTLVSDVADSYFLREIYGPDGPNGRSWVRFTYREVNTGYHKDNYFESIGKAIPGYFYNEQIQNTFINKQEQLSASNYTAKTVYLSNIETPRENISFTYSPRNDLPQKECLTSISVYSKNRSSSTSPIHRIVLGYSYFVESSQPNKYLYGPNSGCHTYIRKRLKLTDVRVDDDKYVFAYNTTSLPYKNTMSVDYWGYYNGINNDNMLAAPDYKIQNGQLVENPHLGRSNRYCSPEYCKAGILEKIVYPTGGYSLFEYEVNHFEDSNGYYMDARDTKDNCVDIQNLGEVNVQSYPSNPANRHKEIDINLSQTDSVKIEIFAQVPTRSDSSIHMQIISLDENQTIYIKEVTPSHSELDTKDTILNAGTYRISITVPQKDNNNIVSNARIAFIGGNLRQQPQYTYNENGSNPLSIGAGLRVKQIRSFNANNELIQGSSYSYEGGKLLIPTVLVETKTLRFEFGTRVYQHPFHYLASQPSYQMICSLGRSTVGYSQVTTEYFDRTGVIKKSESKFHNASYTLLNSMNFYHLDNGLNGKLIETRIKTPEDQLVSQTTYQYDTIKGATYYFPTCESQFIQSTGVAELYQLSIYPKFRVWTRLTQTVETQYENGIAKQPITTSYTYNESCHKPSIITKICAGITTKTMNYYPSDETSSGHSLLMDKHCVGLLTGTNQFINNHRIGGSKIDFSDFQGFPVVNKQYSIMPNNTNVLEFEVTDYDSKGNMREYMTKDSIYTTIIWSYNSQLPILQIVGVRYNTIARYVSSLENMSAPTFSSIQQAHLNVKNAGGLATAVAYDAWFGVSEVIAPNGTVSHYSRDNQGRLQTKKDDDNNLVEKYLYHYKQTQ